MHHFFENIVPRLQQFGGFGHWFVMIVAFAESFAFIGLLIPGSFIIPFMGFLASQGYYDIKELILFSTIGAVAGDWISFYLGRKGINIFKNPKYLKFLEKGEYYLSKHGGKSVFAAKFIGPLRPVVPFAAGILNMKTSKFLLWNGLSGIAWGFAYLLSGFFFGEAWRRIERVGGKILLIAVIAAFVAIFLYYRRQQYLKNKL